MLGLSILGLLPSGRRDHRGLGHARAGASSSAYPTPSCEAARQRGRDDLPGLAVVAESDEEDRRAGGRAGAPVTAARRGRRRATARSRCSSWSGLPRPKERLGQYPHQLSGGLRQRVMIAIALACEPKVLLADEPTTALDVTIQAQILALLDDLEDRLGMATLLVTHDMGVVAGRTTASASCTPDGSSRRAADRGASSAPCDIPTRRRCSARSRGSIRTTRKALVSIRGLPPDLTHPPAGCRFAPRCPRATEQCVAEEPPLTGRDPGHLFACWHPVDGPAEQPKVFVAEPRRGRGRGEQQRPPARDRRRRP